MEPRSSAPVKLPRITITYCTKCKWLLRAAYYGQELLSTFETSIGELVLTPTVGGIFTVHLEYDSKTGGFGGEAENEGVKKLLIWDRKTENGFPETKILKQKIRNVIQPDRNLGHSDTPSAKGARAQEAVLVAEPIKDSKQANGESEQPQKDASAPCEDCK